MGTPRLILVTGPAGAGKTTLAHRLAAAVGCPALCRDEIKEGMARSHPGFVAGAGDELTMRTFRLFFDLLQRLLAAQVTVVAEAAFQHHNWVRGLETVTAEHRLAILRCRVDPAMATARVRQRLAEQPNRTAHADEAYLAAAAPFDEINLDAPTLDVDTSSDYRPALADVAAFAVGS